VKPFGELPGQRRARVSRARCQTPRHSGVSPPRVPSRCHGLVRPPRVKHLDGHLRHGGGGGEHRVRGASEAQEPTSSQASRHFAPMRETFPSRRPTTRAGCSASSERAPSRASKRVGGIHLGTGHPARRDTRAPRVEVARRARGRDAGPAGPPTRARLERLFDTRTNPGGCAARSARPAPPPGDRPPSGLASPAPGTRSRSPSAPSSASRSPVPRRVTVARRSSRPSAPRGRSSRRPWRRLPRPEVARRRSAGGGARPPAPRARGSCPRRAVCSGALRLDGTWPLDDCRAALCAIRGIGPVDRLHRRPPRAR
jgi:hypothetical protein